MSQFEFDAVDAEILQRKETEFNKLPGPRVGDYLKISEDEYLRFTHDWDDTIQTTVKRGHPCSGDASFYLSFDGHVSFSGSLDPGINKAWLIETEETKEAGFWFFHHDHSGAGRGVHFTMNVRVYALAEKIQRRVFKIVDWVASHLWLVEITGKDGSYTPILELKRDGDGSLPTYNNQIYGAARMLEIDGPNKVELYAAKGRECNCGNCECCAAAFVLHQANVVVTFKSMEGWKAAGGDLGTYLQIGDPVAEDMADYFLGVLPPATWLTCLIQIGEPHSHVRGRATFATLHKKNGVWTWVGNCYRGEHTEPRQ